MSGLAGLGGDGGHGGAGGNGGLEGNVGAGGNQGVPGVEGFRSDFGTHGEGIGGGISSNAGHLQSNIVADNSAQSFPNDLAGAYVSAGYNLIKSVVPVSLAISGSTALDIYEVSPGFEPSGLRNNGGATSTIALAAGSPAIDAGVNWAMSLAFDQRGEGFVRVAGLNTDIGAFEVQDVNQDPTVVAEVPDQSATEDTPFSLTLVLSEVFADSDPDDVLTVTATGLPAWLSFDSQTLTFSGTPLNGDVTTSGVTITLRATDSKDAYVETTFDITVANTNDAPTQEIDLQDEIAIEDTPFTLIFSSDLFADVDVGDSLTLSVLGLPNWLTFDPVTRTLSGTPTNSDVTGVTPISLTVVATDLSNATEIAGFTLAVLNTNDPPAATEPLLTASATEDVAFTYTIPQGQFTDIDVGDSLHYSVTGLPSWLSFDPQTLTFSGTPGNGDVTIIPTLITITATDNLEATASATLSLTVINVNDFPTVANPPSNQQAIEDEPFVYALPNDTFADVDAFTNLVYSASGMPSWLSFDPLTRVFSGTPDDADTATTLSTITVAVDDGSGGTATTSFELTLIPVNDHTPEFSVPSQTVSVQEQSANGTSVASVSATDADLPAESLTYSIISGNTGGAFAIDSTTGAITVANSAALDFGTNPSFLLTIQVSDNGTPGANTATATVTVNLTQLPGPTITLNPSQGLYFLKVDDARIDPTASFTNQRPVETFEGAQLTVTIAAGQMKGDTLKIISGNKVSTKGNRVFFKGVEIGEISKTGDGDANLIITFNSAASTAALDALVKQLSFFAKQGEGQTRTVTMQVLNLSENDSAVASREIRVEKLPRRRRPR